MVLEARAQPGDRVVLNAVGRQLSRSTDERQSVGSDNVLDCDMNRYSGHCAAIRIQFRT